MVREWKRYVADIAQAAHKILSDAAVYVFGSVVKSEATGGSDVDVLIVSKYVPASGIERAKLLLKIEEGAGLPSYHPFEIHLVNTEEAEWYFRKVKELTRLEL